MKIEMNDNLQSLIIAVKDYRAWLYSDLVVRNAGHSISSDEIKELDSYAHCYYRNLNPSKYGLSLSDRCFEAVLQYPIEETLDTESEDLPKRFSFGW